MSNVLQVEVAEVEGVDVANPNLVIVKKTLMNALVKMVRHIVEEISKGIVERIPTQL